MDKKDNSELNETLKIRKKKKHKLTENWCEKKNKIFSFPPHTFNFLLFHICIHQNIFHPINIGGLILTPVKEDVQRIYPLDSVCIPEMLL